MKKILSLSIVLLILSLSNAAQAKEVPFIGTLGHVSLDTRPLVAMDLHMPIHEDYFALMPEFLGQYGWGWGAVGLNWGFNYAMIDGDENGFWPGNIDLFFKGRHCIEGDWRFCFGGQLDWSWGPKDNVNGLDELPDLMAMVIGYVAHLKMSRFNFRSFVITPTLGLNLTNGIFFMQANVGTSINIPYGDDDEIFTRDVEAVMEYSIATGPTVVDLISFAAGFRGLSTLTNEDDNSSLFAIDIITRLHFKHVEPSMTVSIPVDEDSRDIISAVLSIGVTGIF